MSWPESDGGLLPFLVQLDLADCPACERLGLPSEGRLYFFEAPTFKAPRPVWSLAYSPGQMASAVVYSKAQPEVREEPLGATWAAETSLTVSHFGRQKWPEDPAVGLTVEPALCLRPDASDPTALAALQKVLDKQNRALARRSAGSVLIPGSFWVHERRDAYLTAGGRANLTRLGRTKSMLPYHQILSGQELATWEAQLEKLLEQQRAHPVAPPVAIDTAMQNSEPFLARAERDAQVLLAATAATAGAASFREQLETSLAELKERAGEGLSLADWASLASAIYSYALQDLPKPEKAALAPLADQPRFCYSPPCCNAARSFRGATAPAACSLSSSGRAPRKVSQASAATDCRPSSMAFGTCKTDSGNWFSKNPCRSSNLARLAPRSRAGLETSSRASRTSPGAICTTC